MARALIPRAPRQTLPAAGQPDSRRSARQRAPKHATGNQKLQHNLRAKNHIAALHVAYKSKCLLMTCERPKCLSPSSSAAVAAASARTSALGAAATSAGRGAGEVPKGTCEPNSCFLSRSPCVRCFSVYLRHHSHTSSVCKRWGRGGG